MQRETRSKLDSLYAVTAILCIGVGLSMLVAWQIGLSAYRTWQASAIADAERLSSELRYRVQREQEPLVAASVLYFGSNVVTFDELQAASAQLVRMSSEQYSLAFAFITPDNAGAYELVYGIGTSELLRTAENTPLDARLYDSVALALEDPTSLVTGALFHADGKSLLPITIAVPNGSLRGALLYLIDFSALLQDVSDELNSDRMHLTIIHPETPDEPHGLTDPLNFTDEFRYNIELDLGVFVWDLVWQFRQDYGQPVNYLPAYIVFLCGIIFSSLAALYVKILLQQKQKIQILVDEKSAKLDNAQEQMIQQGKLAALGGMVAGISHELNTPIGNGLMGASILDARTKEIKHSFDSQQLTQSELSDYLNTAVDSSKIVEQNLRRAANLISSFKQVAVDQTSSRRRHFNVSVVLNEMKTTLQPQLKHTPHVLIIECPENLPMQSYPGPLGQVLTNLVMNSLKHALSPSKRGIMKISVTQHSSTKISIRYTDNGIGIDKAIAGQIFDPFFTTQLGQGGSGLGLHIVWSLVSEVLGGDISLENTESVSGQELSEPQRYQGAHFLINLPVVAP
jgi:signal transduction histidine kinase